MTFRTLLGGLPLLLPFTILLCDRRWELAAAAVCFSAFVLPGTLLVPLVFSRSHPLGGFPGRFGVATVASLLLFGLPGAAATILHWRLSTFLIIYAVVYLVVCAGLVALLLWHGAARSEAGGVWSPLRLPTNFSRWTGVTMLAGAGIVMSAVVHGADTESRPWWYWTSIGVTAGVVVLIVFTIDRLWRGRSAAVITAAQTAPRSRRSVGRQPAEPTSPTPPSRESETAAGGAASRTADARGAAVRRDRPDDLADLPGAPHETWIGCILWLAVASLTVYLMSVSYQMPEHVFWDDVTYVSQAVDFLSGGPMDRYEPSLGLEIPQDPGFIVPTVSLLSATFSWATGVPCAAFHHSVMLPLLVLAGVSAIAAGLSVVLRGNRLVVPLALLVVLMVLLKSSDGRRSYTHFLFYRTMNPKSVHLLLIVPLQLASLWLVATRANPRHTLVAIAIALIGHAVHPWSTAAGAVWSGALLLFALLFNRSAFLSLLLVAVSFAALGGLYHLKAKYDPFGIGHSSAKTPTTPIDLVVRDGTPRPRLEASETIGTYSLFRLGILALPFVLVLGQFSREWLASAFLSLAALAIAYIEPIGVLFAAVMETALLWRTRWMVPSTVNATALAVGVYWAVTIILRRSRDRPHPIPAAIGAAVAVSAVAGMLYFSPSKPLRRGEPVKDLAKFAPVTHQLYEELGGFDGDPYVLAPTAPVRRSCRIPAELPQLMPRVKLFVSRPHIIKWFLGEDEMKARMNTIARFYLGLMRAREFHQLMSRFPIDCVIVDYGLQRRAARSTRLLRWLGWQQGRRFGQYEIWRAPG